MASSLTPEQLKRIEQNRRLALEKRAARYNIGNQNLSTEQQINNTIQTNSHLTCSPLSSNLNNSTKSTSSFLNSSLHSSVPVSEQNVKPKLAVQFTKHQHQKSNEPSVNPVSPGNCTICGSCRLISKDRFAVIMPYHKQSVDVFKTIKGFSYGKNVSIFIHCNYIR